MANNRDLGKITIQLELLTAKFEQASKQTESELEKLGKRIGSLSAPLAGLQSSFANAAVGILSLSSALKTITVGADFEDAFLGVAKTVSATPVELDKVRESLLQLSTQLPVSASELAHVAESAGQLGIQTASITEFTATMAKLGLATNLSATEGADALARFANVTGMSQDNFDNLASTIVALGNTMASTEKEIAAMATRLAATGAQVGMSESQIVAFAATLSSLGVEAEAGGSAFSKLFRDIEIATVKGGDALNQFAAVSGKSGEEFARLFKDEAATAVQEFLKGLDQIEKSGGSAIAVLDEMGITETRMVDAILRTAGASDLLTTAINDGAKAWESNNALTIETEKRIEGLVSKWEILKNSIAGLAIIIADSVSPAIKGLLDGLTNVSENFKFLLQDSALKDQVTVLDDLSAKLEYQKSKVENLRQAQVSLNDAWFNASARQEANRKNLAAAEQEMVKAQNAYDNFIGVLRKVKEQNTATATATKTVAEETKKSGEAFKGLPPKVDAAAKSTDKYNDALDTLRDKLSTAQKSVADLDLKQGFDDAIASMDQVSFDKLSLKMLEGLKRAEQQALPEAVRGSKIGEELANQIATANWSKAMKPLVDEFEQVGEELTFAIEESEAFEALRVGIAEAAGDGMAQGLDPSSLDSLASSGLTGMGMEQKIADEVIGGMNAGLQELANGGSWGDAAGAVGIDVANSILPGLGDMIKLFADMDYSRLFGGNDPGTEARQNIESFLEDTLQANFETGGYIQEGWAEKFQAIAGDGATAFEAVGTALAVLAGESAEYGGQIGYILAENLNGNLESLPLLFDTLGISIEQMGGALEEVGLKGELSWAQLETFYQGLDEANNRGIGGVGDLIGAYANLEMSGGRGAMAIESLRQVAIEAQEAGAESLQQLQGVMSQLGFSQEEIDRMVSVLQSRGITNMEQLETASTRTLGSIVAGLESAGMQWEQYGQGVDSAIDKVTALEEKIMGIQSRDIDINVNVNYSTSGEPPKANAIGNAFDGNGLVKLAKGGVITSPTYFSAKNYSGIMGEAGAEAVMPLRRTANGELGVIGGGGSTGDIVVNVYAPNSQAGVSSEIIQAIKSVHKKSVYDAVNTVVTMHRQGAL